VKKLSLFLLIVSSLSTASSAQAQEPETEAPVLPPVPAPPQPAAVPPAPAAPAPEPQPARVPEARVTPVAEPEAEAEAEPANPRHDGRVEMWRLEMGYRGSFVTSTGFDPFSTNDFLPAFSIAASRTVLASGPVSFAPGLSWDYGSSAATARGDSTSLSMHRLTVPLEGRVHFVPWGYALLRVAPGVVAQHAEVDDSSAPAALTKNRWLFATDVSVGYAWLIWPQRGAAHHPRLWLQADGGYGWVAGERLDLAPALASGDSRVVSGIDLGSVTMSGAFFRAAAAVSF
jgi:hypothetical protein